MAIRCQYDKCRYKGKCRVGAITMENEEKGIWVDAKAYNYMMAKISRKTLFLMMRSTTYLVLTALQSINQTSNIGNPLTGVSLVEALNEK